LAEAARFYVENHTNIVQKRVSEVVQELVNDRQKNGRSPSYLRDLRTRLGNFADSFKCPIASVNPENIEAYLDSTGAAGHYRKNLRDGIGTLFNFARKRKYVQRDHPGVSPITKPSLVPHEVKIFTPEEFSKLLNAVPDRLLPALALGGFTALRTAEIERLDWSQINLREGHIEIKARVTKKKTRRIVPIPPNLERWLLNFHQPSGRVSPYKILSNQWAKFASRAGVHWSRNVLRDSGISCRVALTGNANLVALESGNSVGVILSNYLKCVPKATASRWYKINPRGSGKVVALPTKVKVA
jgi:integrase